MPVIINDFEIVAAPPQQASVPGPQRPNQEPSPQPLRPEDVERILRRFVQRRLRLWAD